MKLERDDTRPQTEVRTNVDFVRHVENTLGFVLDPDKAPWKARQIEAGKLKRKRAKDSERYSIANLMLTVEYLRRRKQQIKSPAAVCFFVDEALTNARSAGPSDLDEAVSQAVAQARQEGEDEWARRLIRAQGPARAEVLAEWRLRG